MSEKQSRHVDLAAAEAAIESLLRALGLGPESDPELQDTPRRVAKMYAHELLDGYGQDPAELLRDGVETQAAGMVTLRGLRFTFVCPHHMLPSEGLCHLAYLPGPRVVGLGSLVRLLESQAHRLVLQEALGQRLADALVEHLGARGAGVVLSARHQCLSARGEGQREASLVTVSLAGSFATDPAEKQLFLQTVGGL